MLNETIKYYQEHYKEYSPKFPIVIPSYQNRDLTILKDLKSLTDNHIILFIYDTDYVNYKQYENDQVEIVQISVPWRSIQRKRHWIQEYLAYNRPEIENYIMLDDDITKARLSCINDGKSTSMYIPVKNALGILEDLHKKYCTTVSGGSVYSITVAHPTKLISRSSIYQTYCFNNKWVKEHPECMFRDLQNVSEDNVIWYDCWKNGQDWCNFQILRFDFLGGNNKKYKSIASTPINVIKNMINALRILKDNCIIHWSKDWNTWAIRFRFNCYEPLWHQIKTILDTDMPGWEDITVTYNDTDYINVNDKIKNLYLDKDSTKLADFLL